MLGVVMDHVTALAERGELVERAVAGIMVQMRTGQHHRCPCAVGQDVLGWASHQPALAVAPVQPTSIPPAAVAEVEDAFPVRAAAMPAAPTGTHEADMMGQLDGGAASAWLGDRAGTAAYHYATRMEWL